MNYKYLIIGLSVLIALTAVFIVFRIGVIKSPTGSCIAISENNGKINVVFLSEGLTEEKAKEYSNFLVNSNPFNSEKEKFNFYYAGNAKCDIVQENILLCYSSSIIRQASICKNDFIVVLASRGNVRSSDYGNVMSLNVNQPKSVFLHEFGHAFANLADEYVPSNIPSGSKNCQGNCNSFSIKDGCFQGCSKSSYYRSIDSSIMKTLSTSEYGKLNTQLIENVFKKY